MSLKLKGLKDLSKFQLISFHYEAWILQPFKVQESTAPTWGSPISIVGIRWHQFYLKEHFKKLIPSYCNMKTPLLHNNTFVWYYMAQDWKINSSLMQYRFCYLLNQYCPMNSSWHWPKSAWMPNLRWQLQLGQNERSLPRKTLFWPNLVNM